MMRHSFGYRVLCSAACAGLTAGLCVGSAAAEQVKLQDGTEFSGRVVGKDANNVVFAVPRSSVATVDGQPVPPPIAEGYPAPAFSVTDLAGKTQTLGSASGEVTIVNFWASWCPHCRNDVDLMKDLFAKYQGKGVRFITVSVDQKLDALNAFIAERQLPYPVVASGTAQPDSPESKLSALYESQGVPAYFIVDRKGVIAKTMKGSITEGKREASVESLLQSLLPTPPAPGPAASVPQAKR